MESYGLTQDVLTEQMLESYVDEQLHSRLEELKAEKDAVENPVVDGAEGAEGEEAEEAEAAEEDLDIEVEEVEAEEEDLEVEVEEVEDEEEDLEVEVEEVEDEEEETEAPEPTPEPRSLDEIEADTASVTAEIEALHAELLPQAQQVIDEFNGGADFDSLIEKYNADPGMTNEPTASQGYAVAANSTTWDPAFTEGAMSIAEVGQISAPVYGMNGIHIIYYLADITPGVVPFEELAEVAETNALEEKVSDTYENQINAWVEEANPVYHADRF